MAAYHYGVPHYLPNTSSHHSHSSHAHHHGRSRRGPRTSSQNAHRLYKAQRSPKELPESPAYGDYLHRLEAAKSFEFDDDELFCPFHLLTEDDLQSIHSSSSSDRGSLSSGSPEGSPLQHQVQPTPTFIVPTSNAFGGAAAAVPTSSAAAAAFNAQQHMKLHAPMAQRRSAIPIVDPSTRSVASPPLSVSPGRQVHHQQHHPQQYLSRRW